MYAHRCIYISMYVQYVCMYVCMYDEWMLHVSASCHTFNLKVILQS